MQFFTFPNLDLHDADSDGEEELHAVEQEARKQCKQFFRRPAYSQLFHLNSFRLINEKIVILKSHGKVSSSIYVFNDGNQVRPVQEWIDEHDGRANTLILMVCSDPTAKIESKQSLVIHPFGSVSDMKLSQRLRVRMFVPGFGYVEDSRSLLTKALKGFA